MIAGPYNDVQCLGVKFFWHDVALGITKQSYFGTTYDVAVRGAGEGMPCSEIKNGADIVWDYSGFTPIGQATMNRTLNEIADGTYQTDAVILPLESRSLVAARNALWTQESL